MKIDLKGATLLLAGLGAFAAALFAYNPGVPNIKLIDRLDASIQKRFQDPQPQSFGMSRVSTPSSLGEHFRPRTLAPTDFTPENPVETETIAALEDQHTQVGLYLFGAAIIDSDAAHPNFRALKGPAAMTRGTPRPAWYPTLAKPDGLTPDALPDWKAIYPLAQRAMKSFHDGGAGFETKLDNWNIAARPVVASQERCVTCHSVKYITGSPTANKGAGEVKLNQAIGGVLYAYRRTQK